MLKILFRSTNRSNRVGLNWITTLERAVGKYAECKWAGHGHPLHKTNETMNATVKRVMPDADWVFKGGIDPKRYPPKRKDRSYKVACFTSDLHYNLSMKAAPARILKVMNASQHDAWCMCYTQLAAQWLHPPRGKKIPNITAPINPRLYLDNLKAPIFHMAVALDPTEFKPSNKPKLYDVTFLGASTPRTVYPFRYTIFHGLPALARKHRWRLLRRGRPKGVYGPPWARPIDILLKKGELVGSNYVEALARSKIFIFGLGRFKYPCLKFVEGMATKTCVMSDPPRTGRLLHYIPDENYVSITPDNWQQKLEHYLTHDAEREAIAEKGYQMFLKYHTVDTRAKQMVAFLEKHK